MENFQTLEQKSEISLDLSLRCSDNFAASSESKDSRRTHGNDFPRGAGNLCVNSKALDSVARNNRAATEMRDALIRTSAPGQRSSSEIILRKEFGDAIPSHQRQGSRFLSCRYCHREFFNSQALGGHQNAHKHERRAMATRRAQRVAASQQPKYSESTDRVSMPSDLSLNADNSRIDFSDEERRSDVNERWWKASARGHGFGSIRYWGSLNSSLSFALQRRTPFSEEAARSWLENLSRLEYGRTVQNQGNNNHNIGSAKEVVDDGLILNALEKRIAFCDRTPLSSAADDDQKNSKLDLSLRL